MKKILRVFAAILMWAIVIAYAWHGNDIFGVFKPKTSPTEAVAAFASSEKEENLIEGEWSLSCDALGFNRYDWKTTLSLDHIELDVWVSFTDWEVQHDPLPAFRVSSENSDYPYNWLYIRSDGSFDPEIGYFKESGLMSDYPGGYSAFEKELEKMGIDWVRSYSKVRAEFLLLYLSYEPPCGTPKQQFDSESA